MCKQDVGSSTKLFFIDVQAIDRVDLWVEVESVLHQ